MSQLVITDDSGCIDIDTPLNFFIVEQLCRKLILDHKELLD
jgi:hypothetical protein